MEYATLNNGIKMPMAGIGTFLLTPDEAEASVLSALQCGYRLIDTANAYVNEKAVGRAMKRSGLKREEIFLETKLWPSFYEQGDAVEKTLQRLDTDYIDLLLIHQPAGNYVAGYRLMEKAYKEGKVKVVNHKNGTLIVEGVNMVTKHQKPSAANQEGGIINVEGPIDASNVMLMVDGEPTRVGFKIEDGKKVRFAKKTGKVIDK